MKTTNIEEIKKAFTAQAAGFESSKMSFTKKEYLDYTVKCVDTQKTDTVLEVASGTCVCGRAIAPYAKSVICLDATKAMLDVGKEGAEKESIRNIDFIEGNAEQLPFGDCSFDIVITRLAFHHFANPDKIFDEMYRVLKPTGKLVIIDMEATTEELRAVEDEIETLRDFSHVKNLSRDELLAFYSAKDMAVQICESTQIPVKLSAWMELTHTTQKDTKVITEMMLTDINGGRATGFYPYMKEDDIYFSQRWLMIVGRK